MAVIRPDREHGFSTVNPVTGHREDAGVSVHGERVDRVPDLEETLVRHDQRVSRQTLMDQSLMLEALENPHEAVVHRQNETGAQLLQLESRVHQCRTVREEIEVRHYLVESSCGLLDLSLRGAIIPFRLSEIPGNARKQFLWRFDDSARIVLFEVPLLEYAQRILG